MMRRPPRSTLFPNTPPFRSGAVRPAVALMGAAADRRGTPAARGRLHRRAVRDGGRGGRRDRKSTRLNSSHANISYAVFCLKKNKITKQFISHKSSLTLSILY